MERTHLFDLMCEIKFHSRKAAFDAIMATVVRIAEKAVRLRQGLPRHN